MDTSDIDRILETCKSGDSGAFDELVALVYADLRGVARSVLRGQRPGTLQPTVLVNEAYLRLAGGGRSFESRAHFFGAAARAMRQVVVGYARERGALKRAGAAQRVTLADIDVKADEPGIDVLALNEALGALESRDSRLAELVELRYFAGFSLEETGEIQGRSLAAVKRDWAYARAWLFERLSQNAGV